MTGASLEDISELSGRKSLTMTKQYAHLDPNKLQAEVLLLGASAATTATSENGSEAITQQVVVD